MTGYEKADEEKEAFLLAVQAAQDMRSMPLEQS